jgi:3-oxoacyl-[acyl-carrier protein] reductase
VEIKGKRAIVTGGVRGLGRAVVEQLRALGAEVTVLDLDAAGLEALARDCPGVEVIVCDVADEAQVAAAMATFHGRHRAADILVNNAGVLHSAPLVRFAEGRLERHGLAAWNRVIASNLTSVFLVASHVVERMVASRTKGVIVNISSVSAAGNAGQSAYSAAKAGVNALTATWAKELGLLGIRAVAIAPGFTDTESTHHAISESVLKETVARIPLRRLGKPEEIARAVVLAIENDFFTGKVLAVDGGLIL